MNALNDWLIDWLNTVIFDAYSHLRRVGKIQLRVQVEIHETQHGDVELREGQHDFEIHVLRLMGRDIVRHNPRHGLALYVGLVVDALDGDKHLP